MKIQPFKALLPIWGKIKEEEQFFENVRYDFPIYQDQGFFKEEEEKSIFFYEIKTPKRVHHGVIAALELADYYDDKIKKHEKTLLEKERQQMALLIERGAMVKPVLLTYRVVPALQKFMAEYTASHKVFATYSFQKGKEVHRFWKIDEVDKIKQMQVFFQQNIPFTYVADGHHRLTTNVLLHKTMVNEGEGASYDQIYCAFFADQELSIEAFNRVVKADVNDFYAQLETVADRLDVVEKMPSVKFRFSVFYHDEWRTYQWKDSILADFHATEGAVLDVDILNDIVLHGILGIEDVRKDERITYIEGVKGTSALTKACKGRKHKMAFSLHPVEIDDLMKVSDANDVMPPKSTWFEPRMRNGLMVQAIPTD